MVGRRVEEDVRGGCAHRSGPRASRDAARGTGQEPGGRGGGGGSYERACTDAEIKQLWEENRTDGSNRGTEAHLQMELWLNSEPCREDEAEVASGCAFVRDQLRALGVQAYRTEWEIYADAEGIAGPIDFVGRLLSGGIVIVD